MQRTDTEMLTWLLGGLQLDDTPGAEAESRIAALAGAAMLQFRGRVAVTAAMTAWMPKVGDTPPPVEMVGGPTVTALGDPCSECNDIDEHKADCTLGAELASVRDVHFTAHALVEGAITEGAIVRVFQSAPEWEGWVPAMGKMVGNQYVVEGRVEAIRSMPATVKVGDWWVPASCCEIVR